MSEPKVQLVDPQGNMSVTGMSAVGVITASSFDGISNSSATSITGTPDLDVGIVTATSFVGQGKGHAGGLVGTAELNLGVTTATSFVGDATGKAAGLTGTPNLNVGLVTATGFTGNVTGTVTGNVTGLAASITPGSNLGVGVCTAIQYHGDGSGLTGAGSSAYIAQNINATGAETIIDLSYGNVIYYTSSSDTTVGFASTSAAEQITFIRDAGNSYTITWPDRVKWNNDTTPTLINNTRTSAAQVFRFTTVDTGLTYNAWQEIEFDPQTLQMLAWGQNVLGNLGLNDILDRSSPTLVGGLANWANTAGQQMNHAGDQSAAALKTDGTLWSQGQNIYGNLGLNDTVSRSSPTQIGTDTTWSSWSMGYQGSTFTTKTDGTLWTFGKNLIGQLGHNSRTSVSSPTQLPGSWVSGDSTKIATNIVSGAINASGELFTMGYNTYGTLGVNDRTHRSSPCQIPGTWKSVDVEHLAMGGLKTNGTIWTWGQTENGQLGQNAIASKSSPVQVGTDTTWSQFHWGANAGIAIKTNGTLWTWGKNSGSSSGQLGLNDAIDRSSPTQIGTDTTWSQVNGPLSRSFAALKTDGSLWVWGNGTYYGNLGLNQATANTPYLSSPTQLPGTYQRIISNTRGFSVLK